MMTKSKKSSAADEMLRQNVFSSIHLSSRLKSDVVQLSTPLCSNCGVNKATSKKKPGSYYLSIYTNKSEPFVVWFKKREDPKGILWLRNYTVRKSTNDVNELELVSRGCPFKCAHKIKLASSNKASEWYQLLRDESRRQPSINDDISSEPFLDSIFDDAAQRSFFSEEDDSKLDLVESDSETNSLSSSVDSEDKLSLNDSAVGISSPVSQNSNSFSYLKGSKSRNLTTSALPPLKAKETKKVKSTSLLLSPHHQQQQYKLPAPVSPQAHRKPLSNCDYNSSETDLAERWSWPWATHKQ